MRPQKVQADNLVSVGFDMAATTLEITFKNGETVQYLYVPMTIYMELMSIGDKDTYFKRAIENMYQTRQSPIY